MREAVVKTGDIVEGRYRIIKTLGEGGMGTVFLAEHALIKRRVAIKVLHPELATDANVIERFMNEARAAGTLGHPNIVESTDMGFTHNHVPYIVFEYLEGTLLTDEIYRVGGLSVRRTVRICGQIASALHAAHHAGVVHRDLKSDNVFLTDKDDASDHVKVLDFGISRFMETEDRQKGLVMGTPEFMAPEQITDPDNVDGRADIYALGVIMYEMLTARRPFSNEEDPRQLLHRIVHEEPPPLMRPEVPHGLAEIILERMMAKRPSDRYQSMIDVEGALETFMTRGDGTPLPIRRSQPLAIVRDDTAPVEIARATPRAAKSAQTPWPGALDTLDRTPTAMQQVMLSAPQGKKPFVLYGLAGAGVLVGALGLIFGMRGGSHEPAALAPQPTLQQPQPLPAAAMPAPRETVAQKVSVELDSDVPGAKVTFRRRVSVAPESLQLSPSDVVELVEVFAPGYRTQRFWLTFDRPTHLRAHLTRGSGIAEASEEETLVALGEVAAPMAMPQPKQVATKAAMQIAPQAIATKAEAPPVAATVALAPRKLGHGAGDGEPQPAPQMAPDLPAVAAMPEDSLAGQVPVTATEVPAATTPTTTAAITAEIPKPELPVAKAIEPSKPVIDTAIVTSVVGSHRPEVLKCFADGKKKDHALKGTVSLQMQVDNAGKIHRVQVQSTIKDPLVAACIVRSANAWRFPSHSGGDANVAYPFTIN
jgi:tRNA A-37 threonylcarbamoyl transferase component Bud32